MAQAGASVHLVWAPPEPSRASPPASPSLSPIHMIHTLPPPSPSAVSFAHLTPNSRFSPQISPLPSLRSNFTQSSGGQQGSPASRRSPTHQLCAHSYDTLSVATQSLVAPPVTPECLPADTDDSGDSLSYVIEYREAQMLTWQLAVSHCRTCGHILDDLPADGSLYFRVRAVNAYGVSEASESCGPVSVKTLEESIAERLQQQPSAHPNVFLSDVVFKTDLERRFKYVKTLWIGKYATVHEYRSVENNRAYAIKALPKSGTVRIRRFSFTFTFTSVPFQLFSSCRTSALCVCVRVLQIGCASAPGRRRNCCTGCSTTRASWQWWTCSRRAATTCWCSSSAARAHCSTS